MKEISEAQARIYNFLRERIQTDGVPLPCGKSVRPPASAPRLRCITTLRRWRTPGTSAGTRGSIVPSALLGKSARFIPVLGRVTAGQPDSGGGECGRLFALYQPPQASK